MRVGLLCLKTLLRELEAHQVGCWRVIVSICRREGWMGGEELFHGSSMTAAALAAGEGWERGLGKDIRAELGHPEGFQMFRHGCQ